MIGSIQDTTGAYFKNLQMQHAAMSGGLLLFFLITFFILHDAKIGELTPLDDTFLLIWGLLFLICYSVFGVVNRKMLSRIKMEQGISKQLHSYKKLVFWRLALGEIPPLTGIVLFLLTHNAWLFFIMPLTIVFFISLRPTPKGVARDLRLKSTAKAKLLNPSTAI